MKQLTFSYQTLTITLLIIMLSSCNLFGSTDSASDISPNEPTPTQDIPLPIPETSEPAVVTPQSAQQNQPTTQDLWQDVTEAQVATQPTDRLIFAEKFRLLRVDLAALDNLLAQAPLEGSAAAQSTEIILQLPLPDGTFGLFRIEETPIMAPGLATKFPEIKTYAGISISDPTATARLDRTPAGFHGMILSSSGTVYIDPFQRGDINHYMSYYQSDYINFRGKERKEDLGIPNPSYQARNLGSIAQVTGPTLRTYRLAVAATVEYTTFQSQPNPPSVVAGLTAIATTVNRVVGIFEREFAVRLELVDNNDLIVFTAEPDNLTNDNIGLMIDENQNVLDTIIGSDNYDIGHVFGLLNSSSDTGSGVAYTPSVCDNNFKAGGVTAHSIPDEGPFDVDYVAHEMGHQFGANHSYNADGTGECLTRNAATAFEPASGVTIMGYAGICDTQNLEVPNRPLGASIPYFHAVSFEEIRNYVTDPNGGSRAGCGREENTGNSPPNNVNAGPDYTIPKLTPFVLSGSANDAEIVEYSWEEFDQPTAPWTNGAVLPNTDADGQNRPIFRSFPPNINNIRIFPTLNSILDGMNQNNGEALPAINRVMQFRLTARDNVGGVAYDTMQVTVTADAGPFMVTTPNTPVIWGGSSLQNITWDVANSNLAPVNCANVNLLLSTDGGNTFPNMLVATTPNDGTETVMVPNSATNQARVKIECADNIFFDISNTNFTIEESTPPNHFNLTVSINGNGAVSQNPNQPTYPAGINITLEAVPDPGWNFVGWSGDLSGNSNPTTITMNSDKTVTATFEQSQTGCDNPLVPPGATIGFCHQVQPTDTLYSLGRQYGVDPYLISRLNQLYSPNLIYDDQSLFIPAKNERGTGPNVYIVKPGDTLASVADQCRLPISTLAKANELDPTATLTECQALIIPVRPYPPPFTGYPPSFCPPLRHYWPPPCRFCDW